MKTAELRLNLILCREKTTKEILDFLKFIMYYLFIEIENDD